jgi:hypothetical protein
LLFQKLVQSHLSQFHCRCPRVTFFVTMPQGLWGSVHFHSPFSLRVLLKWVVSTVLSSRSPTFYVCLSYSAESIHWVFKLQLLFFSSKNWAVHTFNPGTQEAEAGGQFWGQPGLHSKTLSLLKKLKTKQNKQKAHGSLFLC